MSTDIDPVFQDVTPSNKTVPTMDNWYLGNTVSGVTEESLPWMLAQGWTVANTYTSVSGQTLHVMNRVTIQNWNVLQELLTDFTDSYNEGRSANDKRYEDVVRLWTEMLDKSQSHLTDAKTELDNTVNVYLTTFDDLETDYNSFFTDVKSDLDDLTLSSDADTSRVNSQFDALVSQADQDMINRGFYSAAMLTQITAGIEERRALALTEIAERLQRQKADITLRKNQIYVDVMRMRGSLIESKLRLTNRKQDFLAYQLDERNKILMGLFGFVERRNDSYPDLGSMAQLTASLAETGASTWQSA